MCFEAAKSRMARLEHLRALGVLAFSEGQPDFSHPHTLDPKFPVFGLHMVQVACTVHLQICLLVCDPASPLLLLPFSLSLCASRLVITGAEETGRGATALATAD